MTSFIQGTKTVEIAGGNFRQTSHTEQHEHHTRVSREDKTIFHGNIYGYTHTATSDDGPIIAYSHTTNITKPEYDENSSRTFRRIPRGVKEQAHQLPFSDTPFLGDGTDRSHNRDIPTVERRSAFLLSDTQHHSSEPLTYPDLDDQDLKAEFHTLSPEMQRYVVYMLGRLEKRTAASGETTKAVKTVPPGTRGPTAGLANLPVDIQSQSSSEPHHIANSILNTPSPQIEPRLPGHGAPETQPLSDAKASTVINKTPDNRLSREAAPVIAPKRLPEVKGSMIKNLGTLLRKGRSLSKIFVRPAKSVVVA